MESECLCNVSHAVFESGFDSIEDALPLAGVPDSRRRPGARR